MKILTVEDVEAIVKDLRTKRPKWMYKRQLIEYEAWLEYYKSKEEREEEKKCSNCSNKALFIWWKPCSSCTPDKNNWKPKLEGINK